jgi:hypothetical protein
MFHTDIHTTFQMSSRNNPFVINMKLKAACRLETMTYVLYNNFRLHILKSCMCFDGFDFTLSGGNVVPNSDVRIFAWLELLMLRKFTMVGWEGRRFVRIHRLIKNL